jgi:hypothetical protein
VAEHKAIAGVSATLRNLLSGYMEEMQQNNADVTLVPPDEEPDGVGPRRVNLYLWRVTENAHLKNQDLPGPPGASKPPLPPLPLELHYLLTPYAESPGERQELLGDAMGVLHDYPVLTDEGPARSGISGGGSSEPVLDQRVREEFDRLKITLDALDPEQLSSLWTSFTVPYRLSAAYSVSVIRIESRRPTRTPGLVGEPSEPVPPETPPEGGAWLHVGPYDSPRIRELRVIRQDDGGSREMPYAFARVGDRLVLYGENLLSDSTVVKVGGLDVTAGADGDDTRLEVPVPDDALPDGTALPAEDRLQPGGHTIRVHREVFRRDYGDGEPYRLASNASVFVLVPRVSSVSVSGGTLEIRGERLVHQEEESLTLIGDRVVRSDRYDARPAGADRGTVIEVPLPSDLESGREYPVRVRVAGAESVDRRTVTAP